METLFLGVIFTYIMENVGRTKSFLIPLSEYFIVLRHFLSI